MLPTLTEPNYLSQYLNQTVFESAASNGLKQFELDLLTAIDSIALLPISDTRFQLVSKAPTWLALLGHLDADHQLVLSQQENFLENFLFDARLFWQSYADGSYRSGQWILTDSQDLEHAFQAIAILLKGQPVLLVQYVAETRREISKILQSAREDLLKREKMEALAFRDELTGLFNRRGFLLHAEEQMTIAKANQWPVTIACFDLDGLKVINDQFGHKFGDQLIFNAATLFKKVFRQIDIVGRVGGDEFLVLIVNMKGAENVDLTMRLKQVFDDWNAQHEAIFKIAFSIGMASDEKQTQTLAQLIEQADFNMYRHKKSKNQTIQQ